MLTCTLIQPTLFQLGAKSALLNPPCRFLGTRIWPSTSWVAPAFRSLRLRRAQSLKILQRPARPTDFRLSGNYAVDQAAKQVQASDNLAVAHCHYLIELNVTDIRLKEAEVDTAEVYNGHEAVVHSDAAQRSLLEWTRTTAVPRQPQGQGPGITIPWPQEFIISLYEWAQSLEWPLLRMPVQADFACTYMEMMAHFTAMTGTMPPTPVMGRSGMTFLTSTTLKAKLQPQSPELLCRVFQEALLGHARFVQASPGAFACSSYGRTPELEIVGPRPPAPKERSQAVLCAC